MKNSKRALTLKIDANSLEDMVVLLRQAMYEIEKLLPAPHDASVSEKNARVAREWTSDESDASSIVVGNSAGTIGQYEFEFHRNSREYTALEQTLLEQGYTRCISSSFSLFSDTGYIYTHPSLAKKCIEGSPLAIHDVTEDQDRGFV